MKTKMYKLIFILLLFVKTASAYIDPGTGGTIISSSSSIILAILAFLAGFILKYFLNPIKRKVIQGYKYLKRYKLISLFIILFIILSIYTIYDGGNKSAMENKVLVIGIDAMDPKVIDALMKSEKLPNFKRLKESGSYSKLTTTIPPETPVAWSAAATGNNPGNYGIFDFINRDPEKYMPKLNLAEEKEGITKTNYESSLKGIPFWKIASSINIPTTIIRWPVTFPAEKINGRMLSGLGVVDIKGLLNSYRFYTSKDYDQDEEGADKIIKIERNEIINTKLYGPKIKKNNKLVEAEADMKIKLNRDNAVITVNNKEYNVNVNGWSDWIKIKFDIGFLKNTYGMFKVYLESTEPEFNMYITSIQIDPENQLYDITYPRKYGNELVNEIGLFYTLGMPEDTKALEENKISKEVFLEQIKQIEEEREKMFWYEFNNFNSGILAFGFDAGDRLQHIFWNDKVLANDGFNMPAEIENYYIEKDKFLGKLLDKLDSNTKLIIFSDHGFSSFERAVSINTWLVENNYMILKEEPGENNYGELFKFVDWSKTKAYSLGFTSIYINLKNRESKGIVEEKDKIVNEIIEKLSKLEDTKTSKKVITKLYKKEDVYDGKYFDEAPDIIIGFNEGYRMAWQDAIGGVTKEVIKDNDKEWRGDHLIDRSHVPAVIFANFKIKKQNPELIDIAPTILDFFNIEEEMDGESLI